MLRSKLHRPWQPRINDGPLFNPYAHTTEPEISLSAHRDIEELDAENTQQQARSIESAATAAADSADTQEPPAH